MKDRDNEKQPRLPSWRRFFVPREMRASGGESVFATSDGRTYVRDAKGTIRRAKRKGQAT
jgi:hypothetical protein